MTDRLRFIDARGFLFAQTRPTPLKLPPPAGGRRRFRRTPLSSALSRG